ncbi:hypothetical protein ACIBCR_15115 [Micromonospora echinospora]|uniref:hypothetical protein n=1 Tax=Micromonospora echinospora TaxID=1877 RepID=UPI0037A2C7E7
MGTLFYAPLGTDPNSVNEWVSLGVTDEPCVQESPSGEGDVALSFTQSFTGRCVSLSLSIERMSAASYWLLFRRRHPRLSRMRSAYRRRGRRRR